MIFSYHKKKHHTHNYHQIERHVNWVLRFMKNSAITMIASDTCDRFLIETKTKKTMKIYEYKRHLRPSV